MSSHFWKHFIIALSSVSIQYFHLHKNIEVTRCKSNFCDEGKVPVISALREQF